MREEKTTFYIKNLLKDINYFAKKKQIKQAYGRQDELLTLLSYMVSVGDITNNTGERIAKLSYTLIRMQQK